MFKIKGFFILYYKKEIDFLKKGLEWVLSFLFLVIIFDIK